MTVPPGTRFGRYEVITEIASGGMAVVYLGRALGAAGFARLVAIKVMHAHYAKDDEFVAMFMDEARLAARIRHPNVVATLDLENDDNDGLYLVMEYVEGDGLLNVLRAAAKTNRKIPAAISVRIALDMLNGLHAAHELTGDHGEPLKLVHRDISPHNVIVGLDGISRITDFGIAHAEERMGATRDGQVKGKLAYMAPEQTSGHGIDRRADLFAVGVVLWECLTARRLFHGQNDGEILRHLLVDPVPRMREFAPEIPESLEAVCHRALERDPELRFSTAAQFADALEEAAGSIGIASARAVSGHIREVAGEKIQAMAQRARGMGSAESTGPSAVRPAIRRREATDPERTVRRAENELTVTSSSGGTDPGTGSRRFNAPSAVDPGTGSQQFVLPRRRDNGMTAIVFGSVLAAVLLGAGGWLVTHAGGPPRATHATASAPTHAAPTTTPPPTPPAEPAQLAAAAVADASVAVEANAPSEPEPAHDDAAAAPAHVANSPTAAPHRASHPAAVRRSRPAGGHAPAQNGGGGSFNPESM